MESRIPPLPSMMVPESFTPADRFMADSARSPQMDVTPRTAPMTAAAAREPWKTPGLNMPNRRATPMEQRKPAMNPTRLLLGLTAIMPLLFFPNSIAEI